MGKLYKRSGIYYADYFDRSGERVRTSTRTSDPHVARQRLRDMELETTDRGANQTEALSDSLDYFVKVVIAGKSAATIRCYRQKSRHVTRLLGGVLVDKLDREALERYIAMRIEEGAHTHTVHKELVVLRGALESAEGRNRFHLGMAIVPRFESGYVPRTTYLTPERFIAVMEHVVPPAPARAKPFTIEKREARKANRALYCLLIALASPRKGELEAMRWEYVDLARNVLQIPKGKTFSRPIAIHPVLRPWLEAMHEGHGPVVEPWANVTRDLDWAVARANRTAAQAATALGHEPPAPIPHVTPNDLRRTFASWLVQAGVSLLVVSRLLGHKSTRMVDLVYGQLDDATLASAVGRLPWCDARVPDEMPRSGTVGTLGHTPSSPAIVNSVEESAISSVSVVPRDGVEPPTRGFSVLTSMAPKPKRRPKLRLVAG